MKIISGLSNEQVLQRLGRRGASAILEGESATSGPVLATISTRRGALKGWKKQAVGMARGGKFRIQLKDIPAGGSYRLELHCGRETARVATFFVGDVWIMAGQSNMEGCGNLSGKAQPHPLARAFSMRHVWRPATEPLHVMPESPDICHNGGAQVSEAEGELLRRSALKGTGVGLFFAREMIERTGVPQGLICTAHGGTSMEQWSPERASLGGESLYASMLSSIRATGQPVAGMLWYQGESDAEPPLVPLYTGRMQQLVAATRRDLGQPRLPWITVQIGKVHGRTPNLGPWNEIQEQQRLLPRQIRNLETVAAIDLPLDDGIHIGSDGYVTLAHRMARAADRLVHGNRRELPPPAPRAAKLVRTPAGNIVEVSFDHVVGGLQSVGPAHGFIMVTPEGEALSNIFRTVLRGNVAQLLPDAAVPDGLRVTYGCGTSPICNVTDGRGHAVPMFGPMSLRGARTSLCSFVTRWRVSDVIPDAGALDKIAMPDFHQLPSRVTTYGTDGFVNERPRWVGKSGTGFFHARIELPEAMKLRLLMGYDGPFRLWLDGKPFFTDLKGLNPCLPDKVEKAASLAAGVHDIHVAMTLGISWGFFLRFTRTDLTPAQRKSGEFVKPVNLPVE